MSSSKTYHHLFKILVVGDAGVGKSSILLQFTDGEFNEKQFPTIGVDFRVQFMQLGEKTLKLALWDTAGHDRFRTLTTSYYRGAQGIILVYDCTERTSFENLESWLEEVHKNSTNPDAVKMLVANKIDKDNHAVTKEEGQNFAYRHSMLFIGTSAKTSQGIQVAFEELVQKILETPTLLESTAPSTKNRAILENQSTDADTAACGC
eukprot:GHVN01028371.1.p1 GENE.GHVN01028371.1~~GHVN01028371.1.p1  ORF type:complete len:206 (+),score=22.93 GHVN01028371.1:97-714(+)